MTQTITLRLITRQAGGGEIVRTRSIDWGEALIGRGSHCDICLNDLAVDIEHGVLRVEGQDRIHVEVYGKDPFLADGQATTAVDLDLEANHTVAIGEYVLVIGKGAEDDIAVTVVKKDDDEYHPTPSLFSLRASMFGRRRMAWTLGITILLLCLIVPLAGSRLLAPAKIHPDQQWSTGPLSKAHAFLEKDCKACHVSAFVAVRDTACLSCHQQGGDTARIDARVEAKGSPFLPLLISDHATHARLIKAMPAPPTIRGKVAAVFETVVDHPRDRCASCHREHTTASPDPATPRTADILRPGKPALIVVNDCAACHSKLKMRLSDTTLIDTPDWNRHPDFRPLMTVGFDGAQPRLQRASLSGHPREQNGLIFSHRIHMSATGGVARQAQVLGVGRGYGAALTCQSCHRPDGAGFKPIAQERDCGACHSLAFAGGPGNLQVLKHHDMRNIPGVLAGAKASGGPAVAPGVLRSAMAPGGLCFDCHTIKPADGPFGASIQPVHIADKILPRGDFNHSVPAHAGIGKNAAVCADCHKADASNSAQDFLIEGIATCKACHGKTEHETTAFAGAQCSECHSYHKPGQAPATGQDRLFTALGLPAGVKPRGLPTLGPQAP